jgi:hypothetical protein
MAGASAAALGHLLAVGEPRSRRGELARERCRGLRIFFSSTARLDAFSAEAASSSRWICKYQCREPRGAGRINGGEIESGQ